MYTTSLFSLEQGLIHYKCLRRADLGQILTVSKALLALRFVWPLCFLAGGLFLILFSDTEIWPLGPQTPWYAITHDVEDLQHKLFALILLGLGLAENQRLRGRWHTALTAWVFPIAGPAGAALLLVHSHSAGMHRPNGMTLMEHIQIATSVVRDRRCGHSDHKGFVRVANQTAEGPYKSMANTVNGTRRLAHVLH